MFSLIRRTDPLRDNTLKEVANAEELLQHLPGLSDVYFIEQVRTLEREFKYLTSLRTWSEGVDRELKIRILLNQHKLLAKE